jgi:hypothetical protein
MSQFLPYFVARNVARDLDARGVRPSLLLRVVVGIGQLAVAVFVLSIVAFVLDFAAWQLGLA